MAVEPTCRSPRTRPNRVQWSHRRWAKLSSSRSWAVCITATRDERRSHWQRGANRGRGCACRPGRARRHAGWPPSGARRGRSRTIPPLTIRRDFSVRGQREGQPDHAATPSRRGLLGGSGTGRAPDPPAWRPRELWTVDLGRKMERWFALPLAIREPARRAHWAWRNPP